MIAGRNGRMEAKTARDHEMPRPGHLTRLWELTVHAPGSYHLDREGFTVCTDGSSFVTMETSSRRDAREAIAVDEATVRQRIHPDPAHSSRT
jgi:hypothetical protein